MDVGVRELRANLSRWLEQVKAGEVIVVTERGKPIARIVPDLPRSKFDRLVAEGAITPPKRTDRRPLPPLIEATGSVSEYVIQGRR